MVAYCLAYSFVGYIIIKTQNNDNILFGGGTIFVDSIEKTLEYHELLMALDDLAGVNTNTQLPEGYRFVFFADEKDKTSWAKIHIYSGEFTSFKRAFACFDTFFKKFEKELSKRCFFVEHEGEKVATATVSPSDEYGYDCAIDWLAINKNYQGKKLAKPLIHKCLEVAKELKYHKILLHTQTHTWLAAKLYLDVGFNPLFHETDDKGWRILKNLTNHYKLKEIGCVDNDKMYDRLSLNVVNVLNSKHNSYIYEIWYKNGQNDVYVRENEVFYHYKFFEDGKILNLIEKYND